MFCHSGPAEEDLEVGKMEVDFVMVGAGFATLLQTLHFFFLWKCG